MTREETISILEESKRQNEIMKDNPSTFWASHQMAAGVNNAKRRIEALDVALTALRPVSREQVEKVWEKCQHSRVCGTCKVCVSGRYQQANFCAVCGAPLTDEAVEMVMERLEALKDAGD